MNIVIVTTADDPLGGVFVHSYYKSLGKTPTSILILPNRRELEYSPYERLLIAYKLLGARGSARSFMAQYLGIAITKNDAGAHLHDTWIDSWKKYGSHIDHLTSLNTAEIISNLRRLKPDLLISIGVPIILSPDILSLPAIGALNIHNGKIPAYRGHFATFWEVYNKERVGYVSIHKMTSAVDTGEIISSGSVQINSCGSFLDLMIEKKKIGGKMLAETLSFISLTGTLPAGKRGSPSENSKYYKMPSIQHIKSFKWNG